MSWKNHRENDGEAVELEGATPTYPISIGVARKGKYKTYPYSVANVTRRSTDTTRRLLDTGY